MQLSDFNNPLKIRIATIGEKAKAKLDASKDTMSLEQVTAANDAIAISKNIYNVPEEQLSQSMDRVASLIKAAFEPDVADPEVREKGTDLALSKIKDVTPRSTGENTTLKDTFPDTPHKAKKTCSSIDPSLIAERILRDMSDRFYVSAQDAFDGYCTGIYSNASAQQKIKVGKLLSFYNCPVSYDKFEKEAESDRKAAQKEINKKEASLQIEARDGNTDTNTYCGNCKSTKPHTKDGTKETCTSCGSVKNITRKAGFMDDFQNTSNMGVLDTVIAKLSQLFRSTNKPIDKADIVGSLPEDMRDSPLAIDSIVNKLEQSQIPVNAGASSLFEGGAPTNNVFGAVEKKAFMYTCGNDMCKYSEEKESQGEHSCPKCGKGLVYTNAKKQAIKLTSAIDKYLKAGEECKEDCEGCTNCDDKKKEEVKE